MASLHKQVQSLKSSTIKACNPFDVNLLETNRERVDAIHYMVDTNPQLAKIELAKCLAWQARAEQEIKTIMDNWDSIPVNILEKFNLTTATAAEAKRFFYCPTVRAWLFQALKRHNKQALPVGFGASNAPPAYRANRGIISVTKANKAQRTEAKPQYVQTR